MKFVTLFTALTAISKVALASYCGRQCDPNKVPETPLSGPLKLVAVVDNKDQNIKYKVAGTVVIENDCVFTVKGFQLTPKSDEAKWYGSSDLHSSEGIILSKQNVDVTTNPTDLTYNIKDTDLFCHASLLTDIGNGGVIRLMDKNYQLIAYAQIAPGTVSTTKASSAATPGISTNKSTTTTKKSTTTTKKSTTTTKKSTTTTKKSTTTTKKSTTTTEKTTTKNTATTNVSNTTQVASAAPSVVEATKAGNDTEAATPAAQNGSAQAAPAQSTQGTQSTTPGTGSLSSVITGNSSQKQGNNSTSGALSSFKLPSLALYVALLVVAFVRF